LVAKILVADDNSNIQKMVGLALKDQGIDVVAVGNGEAAVRKISDVHPDLVLADVFMPVRNGYEVCQYVKGDSALAHIPVILLVGAFDPLDEQEAQRVGADGVLKKPFVPPDPLISMVKSALIRAGVPIGSAPPAPAVKEEPVRVAEMLAPRTPPSSISLPALEGFPNVEGEPAEEMPSRPAPVRIDTGSQPLAFGSLLETPTEQEDDLGYATTARPELERDWKSGRDEEEEVEEEEEEKASSSWRRDGGDQSVDNAEEPSSPVKDWRETAFGDAPAPARKSKLESWTPQKEVSPFEEAAETEESVTAAVTETPVPETRLGPVPIAPASTMLTPAPVSTIYAPAAETSFEAEPVTPVTPVAPLEPVAPAAATLKPSPLTATLTPVPETPFSQDAWAAALREPAPRWSEPPETPAPTSLYSQDAVVEGRDEAQASAPVIEMPAPAYEPPKAPTGDSWFSAVSSPWDAEAQKASQLASTWDLPASSTPKVEAAQEQEEVRAAEPEPVVLQQDPFATVDSLPSHLSQEVRTQVEEAELPAGTVEAIREETQQVTDTVMLQKPVISAPAAAEPAKPTAPAPAVPSMEELVAKVLAQMSPEVLQAVTREILKPVVEAMVRDELNGKK
jgi:CheY-like chemotaxis protein